MAKKSMIARDVKRKKTVERYAAKRAALMAAFNAAEDPMDRLEIHRKIQAKEILYLKETLNGLMAQHTGQPLDKISEDTDRDYFLSPAEAVEYGLIDRVVDSLSLIHISEPRD